MRRTFLLIHGTLSSRLYTHPFRKERLASWQGSCVFNLFLSVRRRSIQQRFPRQRGDRVEPSTEVVPKFACGLAKTQCNHSRPQLNAAFKLERCWAPQTLLGRPRPA